MASEENRRPSILGGFALCRLLAERGPPVSARRPGCRREVHG